MVSEESSELSSRNRLAIRRSAELGKILQSNMPSLLDEFKRDDSETVSNVMGGHSVSRRVARSGVWFALKGYEGGFNVESYEGSAREEDLEALAEKCRSNGSKRGSRKGLAAQKRLEVGIYGKKSKEELSRNAKKGGEKGGPTSVERGTGVHAMTHEEHRQAGLNSVISQGKTPFVPGELELVYRLTRDSNFQHQKGWCKGRPNWKSITYEVNRVCHGGEPVRTKTTVNVYGSKYIRMMNQE